MNDQIVPRRPRDPLLLALVAAVPALVVGLIALLIVPWPVALLLAVVAAVAVVALAWRSALPLVLRTARAEPADPADHARYHNLIEGLCVAGGLPKPDLRVIDDPGLNALVAGLSSERSTVAVTTGLLDGLSRVELEAVLAHALSRIRRGEVATPTLATSTVGAPVALGELWRRPRADGSTGPLAPLGSLLLAVGSPVAAPMLRWATAGPWAAEADVAAIDMTRYPPALVAALGKLRESSTEVRGASRATVALWLASPLPVGAEAPSADDRFVRHPSLDERISAVEEL